MMENLAKILSSTMPIIGILVGAFIQSFFARRMESKKQALTFKSQAYIDYLKAFSESAHVDHLQNEQVVSIFERAANAKNRIAIFGSEEVIEALANFIEKGESLGSSEQKYCAKKKLQAFNNYQVIRNNKKNQVDAKKAWLIQTLA